MAVMIFRSRLCVYNLVIIYASCIYHYLVQARDGSLVLWQSISKIVIGMNHFPCCLYVYDKIIIK